MADEPKPPTPSHWEPILLVGGIIGALLAVAIYRGTIHNISGQGFFQSPLPPVGDGSTYNSNSLPTVPGLSAGQQTYHPGTTSSSTTNPNH